VPRGGSASGPDLATIGHVNSPRSLTAAGAAGLDALRENPAEAVLGFDFDGTLAPIVADPASARAHPDAAPALARLAPLVGSLLIVTGRPAAVAVEYGGFEGIDGLVVLGQYGLERWESGTLTVPEPPPGVAEARAKLPGVLAAAGAPPETFVEDKGQALAVHTRRCAEPQVALDRLRSILAALAERTGLSVEPGRFVLELRPPGMDKGKALRSYIDDRGTRPSAVLFAGDDLGDLEAFEAVRALRDGGLPALLVCSGSEEQEALAELADVVVDGPGGVLDLLDGFAAQAG
jgi:trehalose 6-phosphate phosphatase